MRTSTLTGVVAIALSAVAAARPETRIETERYPNGAIRRETSYRGNALDGPSRGWYETGAPMFVYNYHNGVSEGVQTQWYPSGKLFTLFHHHDGHELGRQQMWNADGTIRSNYVIKDGRRFGLLGAMGCTGKGQAAVGDMQ